MLHFSLPGNNLSGSAGHNNLAPPGANAANNDDDVLMKSVKGLFAKKLVLGKFDFVDLNPRDVAEVSMHTFYRFYLHFLRVPVYSQKLYLSHHFSLLSNLYNVCFFT